MNTSASRTRRAPWLEILFCTAMLALILLRGLEIRAPELLKIPGEDEYRHNYTALAATQFKDISGEVAPQLQPALEYALRRAFWFNLFGWHERSWRTPGLVYSLLTVLLVFFLVRAFLWREGLSHFKASALGLAAAAWLAGSSNHVLYSGDGRHYAFVAACSTAWFGYFLLSSRRPLPIVGFTALSVLFANSHFFSFPLIAAGYGLLLLECAQLPSRAALNRALGLLLGVGLVFGLTAALNGPALDFLRHGAPKPGSFEPRAALLYAVELWKRFGEQFEFPISWMAVWALALFGARRGQERKKAVFLLLVVLPAFFLYLASKSSYAFATRYYTPFYGLGVCALALAMRALFGIFERTPASRLFANVLVLPAGLVVFFAPLELTKAGPDFTLLRHLPLDHSPISKAYEEIKAHELPVLVIHPYCFQESAPLIYLRYNRSRFFQTTEVIDTLGCAMPMPLALERLQRFLSQNPKGLVVYDHHRQPEADCRGSGSRLVKSSGLSLSRVAEGGQCVWIARGLKDAHQAAGIGRALGLPCARDFR